MKVKMLVSTFLMLPLLILATGRSALGQAQHVRWDIISLDFSTVPPTFNPGGFAEAKAPDFSTIRFTGSGTFVVPAGRAGGSSAVTGGGTWQTRNAANVVTGSGAYEIIALVTFEFAGFQSQTPTFIDSIGDTLERANGTAVLKIEYSDGEQGVLVIGCHGPGAPDGIFEGVSATKGFKTYDTVQSPAPLVDANRTIFHVRQ